MNNIFKRTLSLLLVLVMCMSMLPASALAEDTEEVPEAAETVEQQEEQTEVATEEAAETVDEIQQENQAEIAVKEELAEEYVSEGIEISAPETVLTLEESSEKQNTATEVNILTAENFPDVNFLTRLNELYPYGLTAAQATSVNSLSVSGLSISDLSGIEYFSGLTTLYCSSNSLNSLDVSSCTELTGLDCSSNNLSSLDVSICTELTGLDCSSNNLSSLDVSSCTELTTLYCSSNNLSSLDLSANSKLTSRSLGQQIISLVLNGDTVDMKSVVGEENIVKVSNVLGGTFDISTGLILVRYNVSEVTYDYNSQSKNGDVMTVAISITREGTCDNNLTWTLSPDGVLMVSGSGYMRNFSSRGAISSDENEGVYPPWDTYTFRKVIIDDGVSKVGDFAFCNHSDITEIILGRDVVELGRACFAYDTGITSVVCRNTYPFSRNKGEPFDCVDLAYKASFYVPCTAVEAYKHSFGYDYGSFIAKHDIVTDERVEPSCNVCGYTEGSHCYYCNEIYIAQETIEPLGHSFTNYTPDNNATCEEDGTKTAKCDRCDATDTVTDEGSAIGHDYGEAVFTWSEDGKSATAKCICANDSNHSISGSATITSSVKVAPTCLDMGITTYTATVILNGKQYTDSKDIEDIPALDHDLIHHDAQKATCTEIGWDAYDTCSRCEYSTYAEIPALDHDLIHHEAQKATCTEAGWDAYDTCSRCEYTTYNEIPAINHDYEISYEWSENGKTCTASATCKNDSEHIVTESATITSTVKTPAGCETVGTTTYTATFENVLFETQTKDIDDIPAKNHDYEISYEWSEDGKSCTASAVCKNDSSHKVTESADATGEQKFAATCTEKGTTIYTAEFANAMFTTQTKDIADIPALEHDLIHHDAKEPTWTEKGWKEYDTCSRCEYTTYEEIPAKGGWDITYVLGDERAENPNNPDGYEAEHEDIILEAPVLNGFTFDGWYLDEDCTMMANAPQILASDTGEKTFYAKWTMNSYSVKFNSNGGSGSMSALTKKTDADGELTVTNKFKRTGYKFAGWNTAKDGTGSAEEKVRLRVYGPAPLRQYGTVHGRMHKAGPQTHCICLLRP